MNKQGMDALEKHFKQCRLISVRLQGQLMPVLEAQKSFKTSLAPFLEKQKNLQKIFAKVSKRITLPNYPLVDLTSYTEQIEKYQKSLNSIIQPAFENLQISFKELPPRIQEALLLLAQYGWYLDFNMSIPDLWEIKESISEGKIDDVENNLVEYFENKMEDIEKLITTQFPHREHIIRSAIRAHRNGDYCLSIPVLLAQTDGICKEVINQYLFMKRRKDMKPKTATYVEQIAADTCKAALFSPLAASMPITASESEREEGFSLLNRHMVLHGESLDYGSKINSVKSISLINYVCQALKEE